MLPIPTDRTSGRRSSSIGCRSIVGRRTSVYITTSASCDPLKASCMKFFLLGSDGVSMTTLSLYLDIGERIGRQNFVVLLETGVMTMLKKYILSFNDELELLSCGLL